MQTRDLNLGGIRKSLLGLLAPAIVSFWWLLSRIVALVVSAYGIRIVLKVKVASGGRDQAWGQLLRRLVHVHARLRVIVERESFAS
jgi:hypothetical protein